MACCHPQGVDIAEATVHLFVHPTGPLRSLFARFGLLWSLKITGSKCFFSVSYWRRGAGSNRRIKVLQTFIQPCPFATQSAKNIHISGSFCRIFAEPKPQVTFCRCHDDLRNLNPGNDVCDSTLCHCNRNFDRFYTLHFPCFPCNSTTSLSTWMRLGVGPFLGKGIGL
jgi:hypothetical protein